MEQDIVSVTMGQKMSVCAELFKVVRVLSYNVYIYNEEYSCMGYQPYSNINIILR